MKKRIAKKIAANYMRGCPMRRFVTGYENEEWQAFNDGTPAVEKTFVHFHPRVEKFILKIDERMNGIHSHWEDPLLVAVDSTAQAQYEEEFNPPHCW